MIILDFLKDIEIPYYALKIATIKTYQNNNKEKEYFSYLNKDRKYETQPWEKSLAFSIINDKKADIYTKVINERNYYVEDYYLIYQEKDGKFFKPTSIFSYNFIEFLFVINEEFLLPVYTPFNTRKIKNWINEIVVEEIYENFSSDPWKWLKKYSNNIEENSKEYLVNCCSKKGELKVISFEKKRNFENFKLVSVRYI